MAEKPTYDEPEAGLIKHKNREYKSRLFSFLFGREENRQWTLSLYNALHGTSHSDPSCITINTMEDVIYMGMKNDLSILVSETVSFYRSMELYEQQSTFNPNMPVREFMYAAKLYDKFMHVNRLNRYGRSLVPLPLPKLVVFYNGEDEKKDETMLSLSDAFREEIRQNVLHSSSEKLDDVQVSAEVERIFAKAGPDIEVKVRMVNINYGHNRRLLCACRPLEEYAWFVAQVRKNLASGSSCTEDTTMGIEDAIDRAIDEMPADFVIRKFIMANRAEVKDMCLTEYNEAETMELLRQEGRLEGRREGRLEGHREGRLEGRREGRLEGRLEAWLLDIGNLMECTGWTAEKVMDALNIPLDQRDGLYAGLAKNV